MCAHAHRHAAVLQLPPAPSPSRAPSSFTSAPHQAGLIPGAAQNKLVLGLREYRSLHLAQSRGSVPHNGLILPPAMRLAPAWILGALRTAALRGSVREVGSGPGVQGSGSWVDPGDC